MSKEVLMSRRPNAMDTIDAARHSSSGGGGYGGGGYNPPPISNYKGVMLCDRPTTKAGGRGAADSGVAMPFACAVGPGSKYEALGLNPSRENRAAKLASDNKGKPRENNDFLSKHKQWLARLNKERQRRAMDENEQIHMAVEKTKKFKEYAAKLRANIREAKEQHADGTLTEAALEEHARSSVQGGASNRSKPSSPSKTQRDNKNKNQKPVWALTEEGLETREEEELDDLLNFTAGLDYEKYIEDYEVKNALAAVKNRISELAQGKARPAPAPREGEEGEGGDISLEGEENWKKAFVKGWNGEQSEERLLTARTDRSAISRKSGATARNEEEEDMRSVMSEARSERGDVSMDLAAQVLNTSRSMRKVHSSRSIRGILEKKGGGATRKLDTVGEDAADVGPTMAPPVMQVYDKEDQGVAAGGAKKKKEIDASNLPYLHRNPAI
mmetsp:Transcript_31910/g.76209  ORF Transcript_31910/g.76209 Transcript_31910/m.76209 type:complete len:442 (+) Transcript_31910:134-1459(+)